METTGVPSFGPAAVCAYPSYAYLPRHQDSTTTSLSMASSIHQHENAYSAAHHGAAHHSFTPSCSIIPASSSAGWPCSPSAASAAAAAAASASRAALAPMWAHSSFAVPMVPGPSAATAPSAEAPVALCTFPQFRLTNTLAAAQLLEAGAAAASGSESKGKRPHTQDKSEAVSNPAVVLLRPRKRGRPSKKDRAAAAAAAACASSAAARSAPRAVVTPSGSPHEPASGGGGSDNRDHHSHLTSDRNVPQILPRMPPPDAAGAAFSAPMTLYHPHHPLHHHHMHQAGNAAIFAGAQAGAFGPAAAAAASAAAAAVAAQAAASVATQTGANPASCMSMGSFAESLYNAAAQHAQSLAQQQQQHQHQHQQLSGPFSQVLTQPQQQGTGQAPVTGVAAPAPVLGIPVHSYNIFNLVKPLETVMFAHPAPPQAHPPLCGANQPSQVNPAQSAAAASGAAAAAEASGAESQEQQGSSGEARTGAGGRTAAAAARAGVAGTSSGIFENGTVSPLNGGRSSLTSEVMPSPDSIPAIDWMLGQMKRRMEQTGTRRGGLEEQGDDSPISGIAGFRGAGASASSWLPVPRSQRSAPPLEVVNAAAKLLAGTLNLVSTGAKSSERGGSVVQGPASLSLTKNPGVASLMPASAVTSTNVPTAKVLHTELSDNLKLGVGSVSAFGKGDWGGNASKANASLAMDLTLRL